MVSEFSGGRGHQVGSTSPPLCKDAVGDLINKDCGGCIIASDVGGARRLLSVEYRRMYEQYSMYATYDVCVSSKCTQTMTSICTSSSNYRGIYLRWSYISYCCRALRKMKGGFCIRTDGSQQRRDWWVLSAYRNNHTSSRSYWCTYVWKHVL